MHLRRLIFIWSIVFIIAALGGYFFYSNYKIQKKLDSIFAKIDTAIQNNPQVRQDLLLYVDRLYYTYKDDSNKYRLLDKVKSYLLQKQKAENQKFDLQYVSAITIDKSARPEIIATGGRLYIIYLDISNTNKRAFNLKIYDSSTYKLLSTKTLIKYSEKYGNPTDIRVVSDGAYIYAFYQTENLQTKISYLWGAKYAISTSFPLVKKTDDPLTQAPSFGTAQNGDELLDDPAPLIGPNGPSVVTRIKDSYTKGGKSIIIVREFDSDFEINDMVKIDVSSEVVGGPRQMSCIYKDGFYYLVMPTTAGYTNIDFDLVVPSDIKMIRFDKNWNLLNSKLISQQYNDTETQVTGLKNDGVFFYIVYRDILNSPEMFDQLYVPLKVYDSTFNIIYSKILYTLDKSKANIDWKPSLDVTDKYLYFGIGIGQSSEIMIYKKN